MGKLTEALQLKEKRHTENPDLASIRSGLTREETKRLNCDVPASIYKKLQLKAIQNDSTISAIVNEWLTNYTNRN